ncbi:hypothetical protein AB751O23_CD_00040 [Chlamydiales bacterium SCGC AB-751-O23]|nr:hypothetical protein AB751O23_CD_00040 [Chlamydiales bacterium SCGC AB-751-O23]
MIGWLFFKLTLSPRAQNETILLLFFFSFLFLFQSRGFQFFITSYGRCKDDHSF